MLIEPASKVSVPFTVVMRTAVNAAPKVTLPPPFMIAVVEIFAAWELIQMFADIFVKTICPDTPYDAVSLNIKNPAVDDPPLTADVVVTHPVDK